MADHIVIASAFRQATMWLAQALEQCLDRSRREYSIHHELFWKHPWLRARRMWMQWDGTCIAVGAGMHMIARIHKQFPDARWCCLWRDPLPHFLSYSGFSKYKSFEQSFKEVQECWCAREYQLRRADELGIDIEHWHMDQYTTQEGFEALVQSLGLSVSYARAFPGPKNVGGVDRNPHFADWSDNPAELEQEVTEMFNSLERSKAAYEEAQKRMKAQV